MTRTAVQFENADGLTLAGRLFTPDNTIIRAYAIFAHCFTCTKNLAASRNIARAMSEEGIATLVFDFTGLGGSQGEFEDSNFSSNVTDLVAAAQFLERDYEAPRILVGHSLGGAAILKAAADIPSAVAVATIASPAEAQHVAHLVSSKAEDIERDGEAEVLLAGRPFKIKKQFLDDIAQQSVLENVASLRKAYLVLHAPLDETVSVDNASKLFVAAKHPKSFISLDNADHLLSRPKDSLYAGRVIAAWATRYLDAPNIETEQPDGVQDAIVATTRGGSFRTDIIAAGHRLIGDEPRSVGGTDLGPSPYDLLGAALAACTTMTLKMYAEHKKIPFDSFRATVRHHKIHAKDCADCESSGDAKIDVFERQLEFDGVLDAAQRERLTQIADRCPVHRTMHGEIKVRTTVT